MIMHTVPFLQQDDFVCSRIRGHALVQIKVRHHHVNYHGAERVERVEKELLGCGSSIMCGVTQGNGTSDWTKCVHPNRHGTGVVPGPVALRPTLGRAK